jgi:gliding motility-associated-like protein
MINNGVGGCGNDIAIDDISFSVCGPKANLTASPPKTAYCIHENLVLTAKVDPFYSNPAYQWQYSSDYINFNDIPGQNTKVLTLNNLALSQTGSYRLLAAETGNLGSIKCGIVSDTLVVKVVPLPVFTVSNTTICSGKTGALVATVDPSSAAISNFTWNNGGGSGATISVSPSSTTTYTATATDIYGCVNTAQGIVTVNQSPAASAAGVTLCLGEKKTLTASGTATSYTWSPATGLSATVGAVVDANPTTTTTYTLTGSANGCTVSTPVVVTVNPKPNVAVANQSFCKGGFATLTATGNATSFLWSPATDLDNTTTATVKASPLNTTIYNLDGIAAGCTTSVSVTVTVNSIPTLTMTLAPAVICPGGTSQLTANTNGANPVFTWSSTDNSLSALSGASVIAKPAATTMYSVSVKDANSCTNSTTGTLTVLTPKITLKPHPDICEGDTAHLIAYDATTYSWSPAGTLNSSTGAEVIANPASTVTYTVTGTTQNCSATATVTLTVKPKPTLVVADNGFCKGKSATFTATGNATTFLWTPSTGIDNPNAGTVIASPAITTIYKVYGIAAGCSTSVNVNVNVFPIPSLTMTASPPQICPGGTSQLTANSDGLSPVYTWSSVDNSLSALSGATVTAKPASSTTYSVSVTDVNSCTNTTTGPLTVVNPKITLAPHSDICEGDTAHLKAYDATTYSWSPAGTLNSSTGAEVIANPASTVTYTVTGTTQNCPATATVTLTVKPKPTLAVPDNGFCKGKSATLSATGNATSFLWTPSTGIDNPTSGTVIANPAITTIYKVYGIAAGCSTSVNVTVNVFPIPSLTMTASPPEICPGGTSQLTANTNGMNPVFTWSSGDNSLSALSGATVTAKPGSSTTYSVSVTDANSCTNTTTGPLTVFVPKITLAPHPAICEGDTAHLKAYDATTYSWSPSASLNTSQGAAVIASPTQTLTYTVTGTTRNCSVSGTIALTVKPKPTLAIADQGFCKGGSTTLTATGNSTSFVWSPATGIDNPNAGTVVANPSVSTTYKVLGIASGCTTSVNVNVNVFPIPKLSLVIQKPVICAGGSSQLNAVSDAASPYFSWVPNDGSLNSNTGLIVTASPLVTTLYTVSVKDINSCVNSTSGTITVTYPTITVSPHGPICIGDTAHLNAYGATSFSWTPTVNPLTPSSDIVVVKPLTTTEYTVTGSIPGCNPIPPKKVNLILKPLPVVSVSPPAPICIGATASLIASGAQTYDWTADPTLNTVQGNVVQATPSATQTYTVTGTTDGCKNTVPVTLTVNPKPIPVIATPAPICLGGTVTLNVVNTAPSPITTTYSWNASPDLNTLKGASVIATPKAVHSVYFVTATDANNCTNSTNVVVNAVNKVIPTISDSVRICAGENVTLTAGGGTDYQWQNDAKTPSIVVSPTVTTRYQVTVRNSLCSATAFTSVIVKNQFAPTLFIPNAFTPNEDGVNDKFRVVHTGLITSFKGLIFDRWGEIIFEWDDPMDGWDGYIKGSLAQIGVYVYKITSKTECQTKIPDPKVGTVTIVR